MPEPLRLAAILAERVTATASSPGPCTAKGCRTGSHCHGYGRCCIAPRCGQAAPDTREEVPALRTHQGIHLPHARGPVAELRREGKGWSAETEDHHGAAS